jgi:hypothetical protein
VKRLWFVVILRLDAAAHIHKRFVPRSVRAALCDVLDCLVGIDDDDLYGPVARAMTEATIERRKRT